MIDKRIEDFIETLSFFDDELGKYEYIIDLGKENPGIDEALKKDEYLVQGCSSKVWLIPSLKEGKMLLEADSNSAIVKGLVTIVITIFHNLTPKEILNYNLEGLKKLNLEEIISPTRQNGVYHMVDRIKNYAIHWSLK